MDIKLLTRNKMVVHDSLVKQGDALIAKRPVKIYIPARFAERNLAVVGSETTILGVFLIVVDEKFYAISSAIAMLRIDPTATLTIQIGEEDYFEFYFEAGSIVIADTQPTMDDTLPYYVYDEFIAKGNIPFYLNYADLGSLFKNAKQHTGLTVGANHAIMEVVVAAISRQKEDKTKYYRQYVENEKQLVENPPAYVPFKSVIFGATNTTARIMGSYFEEGLTSALVNPSERLESIEEILRR